MSIYDHLSFYLDKGAYHPGTGDAHRKRNVRYAAKKYFTKGSFLTIFGEGYRLPMAMNIYIQTCAPHEKTFSILRKKFRNSAQIFRTSIFLVAPSTAESGKKHQKKPKVAPPTGS